VYHRAMKQSSRHAFITGREIVPHNLCDMIFGDNSEFAS
jgi:hypothetical protein